MKKQVIGWILTIILAIIGAIATSSSRLATCEVKEAKNEEDIRRMENQYNIINQKLDNLLIKTTSIETKLEAKKDKWEK